MLAIAALAVAVVLLATGSDDLGGAHVQIRPWAPRYAGD
jgi:hypothetical protein